MSDNPFTSYPDNINNKAAEEDTERYLAKDVAVCNNSRVTHLNNNDMIVGSSSTGKTTSYVYENIAGMYGSYIIADTKGNLAKKFAPLLRKAGYDVRIIDFVDVGKSAGYNPMDNIRQNADGSYNEQDIQKLAHLLSPVTLQHDPYWESCAENIICALISLVFENCDPTCRNLTMVSYLSSLIGFLQRDQNGLLIDNSMKTLYDMFDKAYQKNPNSFACKKFARYKDLQNSDKTWSCIISFIHKVFALFDIRSVERMFQNPNKIDLAKPGKEKCAYFVNVSDVDRSMDQLVNIFYSQIIQVLMQEANNNKDSRLDIPVRFILDDFATNVYIPDFDKIISVIRSREISVSLILQSITQLDQLYGVHAARTIINNCDHFLYLGGHDYETCQYISQMTDLPVSRIIDMPLDKMYILTRGQKAVCAERLAPERFVFDEESEQDETTDSEKITLAGIPRTLLRKIKTVGPPRYKFCFAYDIDRDNVIYASLDLPAGDVALIGSKCRIALGNPRKKYVCDLSEGDETIELTAAEIADTFSRNKERYISRMKQNNPNSPSVAVQ